jgi:hypothetical protein
MNVGGFRVQGATVEKENFAMQSKFMATSDNCCFILIPIDGMTEGLASNKSAKLGSKTHL